MQRLKNYFIISGDYAPGSRDWREFGYKFVLLPVVQFLNITALSKTGPWIVVDSKDSSRYTRIEINRTRLML